jgi:hypothetical protein
MDLLVDRVEGEKKVFRYFWKVLRGKIGPQTLDHRLGSSKIWIDGLVHQIQLMTYGNGMNPIENPPITLVEDP